MPHGFTLTELLIVIALIVLLLAMAVPAFKFITGGRSIDGAQNIVSAMLGRARARAVETERDAGVAFYLDPATGRSTMTIVVQRDGNSTVEDPYINYKGWNKDAIYSAGQEVIAIIKDGTPTSAWPAVGTPSSPPFSENRLRVQKFVSLVNNNKGNHPPDQTDPNTDPGDKFWATAQQKFVDFDVDAESEAIPVGVGVQLVNDTKGIAGADRYIRTGVVMFDGEGRLLNIPYGIRANSELGVRLHLTSDIEPDASTRTAPNNHPIFTQSGLVLYELAPFQDAGYTENDSDATFGTIPAYGPAAGSEAGEEGWLDSDGFLLSINRYNGTLVRAE